MKLFTKNGCQKCAYIKQWIPTTDKITTYDIDTAEGLAELAYLGLIPIAEKTLPILVKKDNGVITGAINIKREIRKLL
jgi:hypothetical protein